MPEISNISDFQKNLKTIYWDIIRGSSQITHNNNVFYIKHLTAEDSYTLEQKENEYYYQAKSKGIPTNDEKLKELIQEGLFDPKNDDKIKSLKLSIEGMHKSKLKLTLKKDIDNLNSQIKKTSEELGKLENDKLQLLESTCEIFASKKMNEFYIFYSLYSDKDCKNQFFSYEDFQNLDQEDLHLLINKYYKYAEKFNSHNLKRVAINNFFLNYFYLSDDCAQKFFGKPISYLSFYQIELFGYARYFRNLMSESKVQCPDEYKDDPDKMIEWYTTGSNMEKILEEKNQEDGKETVAKGMSIMGATKEDVKKMQEMKKAGAIDLAELAAKNGGALNMQELLKIHGF